MVSLDSLLGNISFRKSGKKKAADEQLDTLVNDNIVLMLSKSWCPFCAKAKKVLKHFDIKDLKIVELDLESNGDDLQSAVKRKYKHKSVPAIWINKEFIGGCDDLLAIPREELTKKLTECGAIV